MTKSDWIKSEISSDHWKPEKAGDELIGVLQNVETNVGPNNSKVYTVETPDHESVSFWGSTVLDNRMTKVQIGQEVKIVYKGKAKSVKRAGAMYKDFDVFYRDVNAADYDKDIADVADEIFK